MGAIWHWLTQDGVGQNISGWGLIAAPTAVWARMRLLPRLRDHERRVREIHERITR